MPTIRSRTCPTCDKPIGPKGHACRKRPAPILPKRPTNFADLVNSARNAARYQQTAMDV